MNGIGTKENERKKVENTIRDGEKIELHISSQQAGHGKC